MCRVADSVTAKLLSHYKFTYSDVIGFMEAGYDVDIKAKDVIPDKRQLEYNYKANLILENAYSEANMQGLKEIGTEHILMAMVTDRTCEADKILTRSNLPSLASSVRFLPYFSKAVFLLCLPFPFLSSLKYFFASL